MRVILFVLAILGCVQIASAQVNITRIAGQPVAPAPQGILPVEVKGAITVQSIVNPIKITGGVVAVAQSQPFEYMESVVNMTDSPNKDFFNTLGAIGWELVSANPYSGNIQQQPPTAGGSVYLLIFKRPK